MPDTGLPGHTGDQFIDNTFTGVIEWSAIDTHGNDHLLAGNACQVSGSSVGTEGHCYYISYGSGVQLRYNGASGAPGYGIHVFDRQRSSTDFRRTVTGLLGEGNVLTGSTPRAGLILARADEGGRGNVIDGVTVRENSISGNDQLGIVMTGLVCNVSITGNTITENGRQSVYVADDPRVVGVTISGNDLTQSANRVGHVECTWYQVAHSQKGARSTGVTATGSYYAPGPPITIGITDPSPSPTPLRT